MQRNASILMLGVAGLGLSIAMFLDTAKKPKPPQEPPAEPQGEAPEEQKVEEPPPPQEEEVMSYKDMYRKTKKQNEEVVEADFSYKGDGSVTSKRLYFAREAYRRARERVPIDANIALAVKLASQAAGDDLMRENDNDSD